MPHIYCLYGTDELTPRYVGLSTQERGRAEQHYGCAADGDPKPVYRWMRRVFLAGHEVHVHILEDSVRAGELRARESAWLAALPVLTNIQNYAADGGGDTGDPRGVAEAAARYDGGELACIARRHHGTTPSEIAASALAGIRRAIRLRAPRVSYNHRGYHGVCRDGDAGAYCVRVAFGREGGRCWSGHVKGETLDGWESRGPIWFGDLRRALAARDAERERIAGDPLFRAYVGDGWRWPADRV
ncbi:MAG: hypothetical protein ACM30I_10620 [Gemmatimonas sp.]